MTYSLVPEPPEAPHLSEGTIDELIRWAEAEAHNMERYIREGEAHGHVVDDETHSMLDGWKFFFQVLEETYRS